MRHTAAFSGAGLAFGLALILSATPARAADADTERARALFDEAGELERHGRWGAAQERLRAALRLRDTPQLHYALGWALENDDKLLEAKAEYEIAVRTGPNHPGGEEVVRLATARMAAIEKKLPKITVRIGGEKGPLRIMVDGREVRRETSGASSVTTVVNPGTHVVRIERGTDDAIERMVYVARNGTRTVQVGRAVPTRRKPQRRDADSAVRPAAPVAQPERRSNDIDPLVPTLLLSGGLAFVAGGGALLVSSAADANERDAVLARCAAIDCAGSTTKGADAAEAASFQRAALEASESSRTKQGIGLALGGVGFVATAVGAVLLLRRDGATREAPRARAAIAPTPGGVVGSAALSF